MENHAEILKSHDNNHLRMGCQVDHVDNNAMLVCSPDQAILKVISSTYVSSKIQIFRVENLLSFYFW